MSIDSYEEGRNPASPLNTYTKEDVQDLINDIGGYIENRVMSFNFHFYGFRKFLAQELSNDEIDQLLEEQIPLQDQNGDVMNVFSFSQWLEIFEEQPLMLDSMNGKDHLRQIVTKAVLALKRKNPKPEITEEQARKINEVLDVVSSDQRSIVDLSVPEIGDLAEQFVTAVIEEYQIDLESDDRSYESPDDGQLVKFMQEKLAEFLTPEEIEEFLHGIAIHNMNNLSGELETKLMAEWLESFERQLKKEDSFSERSEERLRMKSIIGEALLILSQKIYGTLAYKAKRKELIEKPFSEFNTEGVEFLSREVARKITFDLNNQLKSITNNNATPGEEPNYLFCDRTESFPFLVEGELMGVLSEAEYKLLEVLEIKFVEEGHYSFQEDVERVCNLNDLVDEIEQSLIDMDLTDFKGLSDEFEFKVYSSIKRGLMTLFNYIKLGNQVTS